MSPVFAPFIRDADFAARPIWHVAERRLLDFLLVWVQDGDCVFTVEGREFRLKNGDWCLVQPGERVELRGLSETRTPYAHFDVFFNPQREESFATRPGQLDLSSYQEFLQPRLEVLGAQIPSVFPAPDVLFGQRFGKMIAAWQSRETLAQIEAAHLLGGLILQLVKQFGTEKSAVLQGQNLGWIPSFLSTHLSQTIAIEEMARRAHLSPSRFQAVFRAQFGVSPGRYLAQLRVRHAAELLETTDWTLAHIAQLCGYADVHHFAKAFKRASGKTPGSLRKSKR